MGQICLQLIITSHSARIHNTGFHVIPSATGLDYTQAFRWMGGLASNSATKYALSRESRLPCCFDFNWPLFFNVVMTMEAWCRFFDKHRIVFQRRERSQRSHRAALMGLNEDFPTHLTKSGQKWNVEWINKYMNKSLWTVFLHKYCNSLSIIASLFLFSVPENVFHRAPWRCHHSTITASSDSKVPCVIFALVQAKHSNHNYINTCNSNSSIHLIWFSYHGSGSQTYKIKIYIEQWSWFGIFLVWTIQATWQHSS